MLYHGPLIALTVIYPLHIWSFISTLHSVEMPRVFSERVVTEPDTHAVSLSVGSRLRQQANTDGSVCCRHQICSSKLTQVGSC